jgi:hypothetical protein
MCVQFFETIDNFGIPRSRCEVNIKMHRKETEYEGEGVTLIVSEQGQVTGCCLYDTRFRIL